MGLVPQQHGHRLDVVLAALLPAVAIGVGQGNLLADGIGHGAHHAQHRHLDHAVPVDLEHLPGAGGVVHHQQDLGVGLAPGHIALGTLGLAQGVDAQEQVAFQVGFPAPGPAVRLHRLLPGRAGLAAAAGRRRLAGSVPALDGVAPQAQRCQGCRSNARRPEEIPPADPAVWMVIHGLRGAAGWAAGPFSFRYTVDSGGIPAPGAWLFYHAVRRGFNRKSQAIFSSFFHLGTSFLDCTSICRNVSRLPSGSLCVVQKCPPKAGSKTQKMAAPAPTKKICPFGGRHQHLALAFRDRLCYNT